MCAIAGAGADPPASVHDGFLEMKLAAGSRSKAISLSRSVMSCRYVHTCLRVRDPETSIRFYDVRGHMPHRPDRRTAARHALRRLCAAADNHDDPARLDQGPAQRGGRDQRGRRRPPAARRSGCCDAAASTRVRTRSAHSLQSARPRSSRSYRRTRSRDRCARTTPIPPPGRHWPARPQATARSMPRFSQPREPRSTSAVAANGVLEGR